MAWLQLKGEQLSGSAYYFNGCKALMFSSVVHFNQATQQSAHGSRLLSSIEGLRTIEACPVVVLSAPGFMYKKAETNWAPSKKKGCKLNLPVARESQTWPGKKEKKEKLLKDAKFCGSEGEKRQMFNFLQCASSGAERCGFAVVVVGGGLLVFAFCQSVCVCAEKYFWLLFFLKQRRA